MLTCDLAGEVTVEELDTLRSHAEASISKEDGIWFVPIYYAYGRVSFESKN